MSNILMNNGPAKSFFSVSTSSDADKLGWLRNTLDSLMEEAQPRIANQRRNLMGYVGVDTDQISDITRRDVGYRNGRRMSKFKINHLFDVVETKVSQFTRLKADIEVKPTHPTWGSRSAATVVKHVIKNIFNENSFDAKSIDIQRHKEIFGESYLFVTWDKNAGGLHPAYIQAKSLGLSELVDSTGKKIKLNKPVYVGDIKLEIEFPWRVFLQRKEKFVDVDYCFRVTIQEQDVLEKQYPKMKGQFQNEDGVMTWDPNIMEERYVENHVAVYEFYHKYTECLDKGRYIKFCDSGILEESDLPYEHGMLPFVRLTDIDAPGYINGLAKFTNALDVQNRYDDLQTLILKNIYFMAHAKYAVPKGAVDIRQLGNDNTIVEFVGAPPMVLQAQPNTADVYKYGPEIIQGMERIMGNHGISRGELPPGITAASALRLINELESIRASSDITKQGQFVKAVARMSAAVAGQYYLPSDERLLKIVGEDNKAALRYFDTADLRKPYEVEFENSNGFPDTIAAKKQEAIEIMQYAGDRAPIERLLDYLDISSPETMVNYLTAAVKNADSENEDLLEGRPVASPESYEDLITKWESRFALCQSRAFKEEAPEEVFNAVMTNLRQIEELIVEKMQKSPIFQAQVARLIHFPVLIDLPTPPISKEQADAVVQGQANRGEPVTAVIPGTPMKEGE